MKYGRKIIDEIQRIIEFEKRYVTVHKGSIEELERLKDLIAKLP